MNMSDNFDNGGIEMPAFDAERLSHAYIARGDAVDAIAMAAVCSGSGHKPCMSCAHCGKASRGVHPDITVVDRMDKKREILVDQIRGLKKEVIVVPGEASRKVYIINDADTMNAPAQNAFLQMLEEPPAHVVFILNTEHPAALLPTVRSRCIEAKDRVTGDQADAADAQLAVSFLNAIEQGNEQLVRFMFQLDKLEKNEFEAFLSSASEQIAARMRDAAYGVGSAADCAALEQAARALDRAGEFHGLNVSSGHISGMLCSASIKVR